MKNQKRLFWILVLLAFLPRLLVCLSLSNVPAVASPGKVTDMATYLRLAREICSGQWPSHFDYQPFYYTVFLPVCRLFAGDSPWGIMIFQILLGTGAVLLAAKCAERIYGAAAGLCTGILLAISKIHVFYTPFALFEVLQSFWMILLLWLLLKLIPAKEEDKLPATSRNQKFILWGVLALLLAAATLTRGNALLLLPGTLSLLIWDSCHSKRRWFQTLLLCISFLVLFELPQLPFALKNHHATGRWVGASTAGEKVLALGNTPEAPAGGLEYPLSYYEWTSLASQNPGRIPMSRQILRWAKKEPILFLNLQWEKLILFWDAREISNNVSLEHEGKAAPWLKCMLPTGGILILAMTGLLCCHRPATAGKWILLYFIAVLWGGNALFYILARFRLAAMPILAIPAGGGLCWLWEHRRDHVQLAKAPIHRRFFPILILFIALFLVTSLYRLWQENVTPCLVHGIRPHGTLIQTRGKVRLYDHGPLLFGGASFYTAPQGGLLIEKTLILPSLSKPVRTCLVRIPFHATPGQFLPLGNLLQVNGETYPVQFVKDRFYNWFEAEVPFDIIQKSSQGQIKIRWSLPKGTSVLMDRTRDYRRTLVNENPFRAEADTEVDFCY